ncbi:Lsr2 family protein [Mycobacterium sp.]|uniref:histone-like nucleoid-structuring protein Lsr2 n=1 Tax=Mycobacterium sp. TaxID=1785 RepID=UPI002D447872|nr:Lsr2 family protein [Mycobacterium sp.]HZA11787.1 Lsr2 family protein [Mycobacterium sp.]
MAQKVTVAFVDDLDGKPAAETVTFALDGVRYEIDLSSKNAKKIRGDLKPWIDAGRRTGEARRRRSGRAGRSRGDQNELAAVREWARRSGYKIGHRGRIPADVVNAYRTAR